MADGFRWRRVAGWLAPLLRYLDLAPGGESTLDGGLATQDEQVGEMERDQDQCGGENRRLVRIGELHEDRVQHSATGSGRRRPPQEGHTDDQHPERQGKHRVRHTEAHLGCRADGAAREAHGLDGHHEGCRPGERPTPPPHVRGRHPPTREVERPLRPSAPAHHSPQYPSPTMARPGPHLGGGVNGCRPPQAPALVVARREFRMVRFSAGGRGPIGCPAATATSSRSGGVGGPHSGLCDLPLAVRR